MTKKHFIEIADFIREHNRIENKAWADNEAFTERQLDTLANSFASINPAFMRERWFAYIRGECGKNGGKI